MKSVIDARKHVHNEHEVPYAKASKAIENLQDEMGEQFVDEFRVCFPQLTERLQFVGPNELGGEGSFSIASSTNQNEVSQSTQSELRVMRFTL